MAPSKTFLALWVAMVSLCGCGPGDPAQPRAVVIGIDSADWRLIDPLIDAGRMPNLAALRERGPSSRRSAGAD